MLLNSRVRIQEQRNFSTEDEMRTGNNKLKRGACKLVDVIEEEFEFQFYVVQIYLSLFSKQESYP